MRRYRERRRQRLRYIPIPLHETDIDAFIRMRLLKEDQRQDVEAIQTAVLGLLYRAEDDLALCVSVGGETCGTSSSIHGLGYLFSALRREGLIADELVLQLATFLRSLDLLLELTVRTVPRTLTANQVQRGGK